MLKAVKECVKNWLVTHERLYWYIVVGLAVLGFGIVTAMGCAKLEQANAAEDVQTNFDFLYSSRTYGYAQQYLENNLGENQYYCIFARDQFVGSSDRLITDNEYSMVVVIGNSSTLQVIESKNADGNVEDVKIASCGYAYINGSDKALYNTDSFRFETGWLAYRTHVYYLEGNMDITSVLSKYDKITVHNKPISVEYSLDAPYTNFQRVTVNYGYEAEDLDDFYTDWMSNNEWKYFGHLNNMQDGDLRYSIDPVFLVQLPTIDYILSAFSAEGINLTVDGELSVGDMYRAFKCLPELVQTWFSDKKAPYVEYEFEYLYDLEPDENGNFTYSLSFFEMEYLLKAFNSDLLEKFAGYSADFRAIYMTFLHVECVTSMVETEREDVILYGKITTNQFERGIYDTCVEVIPEIDPETMTPEEMDEILSDATQDAHDKYIKDLEDRLDKLESQMGGMTSVDGAFGDLEGSDLWTGFQSLVEGLGSLAPSIRALSVLTGAVFGFLPITITGIMSTTLFAICIIAIVKAIRG